MLASVSIKLKVCFLTTKLLDHVIFWGMYTKSGLEYINYRID